MDDSGTDPVQTGPDSSSTSPTSREGFTAADALDELCLRLVECRLVMQALTDEIGVDMRTLEANLHMVEHGARRTREAASLICQGAELADGRPHQALPHDITGKHWAAVRRGAVRIVPEPTRLEQTDPALATAVAAPPFYDQERKSKRRCTATADDGSRCSGRALYLGNHGFADCERHAPEYHLARHLEFRDSAPARAEAAEAMIRTQVTYGRKVIDEWLHRRRTQPVWFHPSPANHDTPPESRQR